VNYVLEYDISLWPFRLFSCIFSGGGGLSLRGFLCHEDKTRNVSGNGSRCLKATKYIVPVRTSQRIPAEVITSAKLYVSL
jgi:hypothetical protein